MEENIKLNLKKICLSILSSKEIFLYQKALIATFKPCFSNNYTRFIFFTIYKGFLKTFYTLCFFVMTLLSNILSIHF